MLAFKGPLTLTNTLFFRRTHCVIIIEIVFFPSLFVLFWQKKNPCVTLENVVRHSRASQARQPSRAFLITSHERGSKPSLSPPSLFSLTNRVWLAALKVIVESPPLLSRYIFIDDWPYCVKKKKAKLIDCLMASIASPHALWHDDRDIIYNIYVRRNPINNRQISIECFFLPRSRKTSIELRYASGNPRKREEGKKKKGGGLPISLPPSSPFLSHDIRQQTNAPM